MKLQFPFEMKPLLQWIETTSALTVLGLIVVAGILVTYGSIRRADRFMREDLVEQTKLVAQGLQNNGCKGSLSSHHV